MHVVSLQASDAELIAASLTEPARFADVFDRHYAAILQYLRRRIDQSSADELAGDTFAVAFRSRDKFDPSRSSARPWLFGIATNLLRRSRRQEARQLRAHSRAARDPIQPHVSGTDDYLEPVIEARLASALASLRQGDREVLFLFACADLSYEEISEAIGIPLGTVRSRLFRARRQVRELLGEQRETRIDGLISEGAGNE
jgi:RNA polymerase sigma factor (sigma-70 family)